jgi:hypothetical protein
MASDPKARITTVAYEGGTVSGAIGLLEHLFDVDTPTWGGGTSADTPTGRKRYKYGTRQRTSAAPGKQVFLDLGTDRVYSVRVTGNIVDFIDAILPKTGDKIKRAYTRRGSVYAPTFASI